MDKAGIWTRVSTGAQDESNQRPAIDAYCGAHGYQAAREYELNDKSAFHGEQEAKQLEALADTRAGHVDVLVVWAADRLERRGAEATLRVFRLFREAGGRVESVQEPFLNGDDPDLMLAVTGWKDRAESKRKSERVHAARKAMPAGFWGRPPFGYTSEGPKYARQLVPDPEQRPVLEEIFKRIADGDSTATVARWLTELTGRRWPPQTVSYTIRNEVYALGLAPGGGGPRAHKCAPLLDKKNEKGETVSGHSLWKQANRALDSWTRRGPTAAEPAMLRGAVRCAADGGPMYAHSSGGKTRYYRCHTCRATTRMDAADAAVNAFMAGLTDTEVTERRLVAGRNSDGALAAVERQLRDLPAAGLDDDAEDAERARLRAERKRLKALPAEPDTWLDVPTGQSYAQAWEGTPDAERGKWLVRHRIVVGATNNKVSVRQDGGPWESGWKDLVPLLPKRASLRGSGKVSHSAAL